VCRGLLRGACAARQRGSGASRVWLPGVRLLAASTTSSTTVCQPTHCPVTHTPPAPGCSAHASRSATCVKPAAMRRLLASSTAW
jgi:hypothetical protein